MASEKDILEQASRLGEMLSEHEATRKLESATKAFESDIASQRAFTDYQRFAQSLQHKAQQGQPIEVQDKKKLDELQQAVITNPLLANMQRAEMAYVDLLRKIDAAIVASGGAVAESAVPDAATAGPGPAGSILGM